MTNNENHIKDVSTLTHGEESGIWALLEQVPDPEVPVLSIVDLGIVRDVKLTTPTSDDPPSGGRGAIITITPTYSGCPAMDVISMNIRMTLIEAGYKTIQILTALSPAWTTDWMSDAGKQKLKEYGIAPPNSKQSVCHPDAFQEEEAIQCPRCNSYNTNLISRFGSTACKSFYQCADCKEPFDYFKCH